MKEYIIQVDDIGERAWDGSRKVFQTLELVRCKDCKHFDYCYTRPINKDNWFCADGERK